MWNAHFLLKTCIKVISYRTLNNEKAAKSKNIVQFLSVLAQKHPFNLISAIFSVTAVKRCYNKTQNL